MLLDSTPLCKSTIALSELTTQSSRPLSWYLSYNYVLQLHSQSWVSVNTCRHDLFVLEAKAQISERRNISPAKCMVDVREGVPFKVFVGNFTDRPQKIPRRMILGHLQPQTTQKTRKRLSIRYLLGISCANQDDILSSAVNCDKKYGMTDGINDQHSGRSAIHRVTTRYFSKRCHGQA